MTEPSFPQPERAPPPANLDVLSRVGADRVRPAAIALIVYNALSLANSAFDVLSIGMIRSGIEEMAKKDPELRPLADMARDPRIVTIFAATLIAGILASILGIVGAARMLQAKSYGLAMTGAIVTMISPGGCCCVIGLPLGIWAMVVLMKDDVQAAFNRS